jgi:hypothetical protein
MTGQDVVHNQKTNKTSTDGLTAGIILITIGVGLLLFRLISMEGYFPLVLGLGFLAAGIFTRKDGLIIPGGIIGGVGLGIVALENAWFTAQNNPASGGIFLLMFALGWFSITLLTRIFTRETHTWALIPGSIIGTIGALVLAGDSGIRVLETAGNYWPVILIVIGVWVLFSWWKERK